MPTLLITHEACLEHDPGPQHPENPGRLKAVVAQLRTDFPSLDWEQAPLATDAQMALAHSQSLLNALKAGLPVSGRRQFDADTVLSPRSLDAARAASGAVLRGIEAVFSGPWDNAFCAVRPPGHHAERDTAMGFCLLNSVAIGALSALSRPDCQRVAIADFDVHHGNGTQEIFFDDSRVLFLSTHQMPLYPGTGGRDETGAGNIVNAPLMTGSGSSAFRSAVADTWMPALEAFEPDLLLVSAGFDAHRDDPLASLNFTEDDYIWITRELKTVAANCCQGRLVSSLEGGYQPDALAASVSAHVGELSRT
ncbi:MAG: histone deacetylase family protein [Lysobacterales bacterium]